MTSFLNPEEILKELKLKENMTAADFGSGSGGWVLPLAKKLEDGKVYAIDILEEPLSALKSRAALEKVSNIETIKSDIERERGSKLISSSCDLVLMTNLLFQCEDKKTVFVEGKRVLKNGGRILVVDWIKDNPLTQEIEMVSFDEIKRIAQLLQLRVEKEFEIGSFHYCLILVK